ncbi:hypothetical protein [Zunongwangia sp.]|uniref:hypothetical protein n=1 Tax=Zunongwangia sp. TaxID=1965325 RepID=UPI003AA8E6E3
MKPKDAINKISTKYRLSNEELKALYNLESCEIKGIAFTTEGGFCNEGNFFLEENPNLGKIRIQYYNYKSERDQYLILNKNVDLTIKINGLYREVNKLACFYKQLESEAKKLYFKHTFADAFKRKKDFLVGLKAMFNITESSKESKNGLQCSQYRMVGCTAILECCTEYEQNLKTAYQSILTEIEEEGTQNLLKSHLSYVIADLQNLRIIQKNIQL